MSVEDSTSFTPYVRTLARLDSTTANKRARNACVAPPSAADKQGPHYKGNMMLQGRQVPTAALCGKGVAVPKGRADHVAVRAQVILTTS